MNTPIETERKFLIKMPDMTFLDACEGLRIMHIEQTYLLSDSGKNARVRRIIENDKSSFVKTVKQRLSVLSCYEDEHEISAEQYKNELKSADTTKQTIRKTRYAFPFVNHIVEIDVYPFWSDRAILEIELSREDEQFDIPDFIEIIKEVSDDKRYKNTNLAVSVPYDTI